MEFFEVTKVSIVDDYDRAGTEFKKKFGAKHTLHKALQHPAFRRILTRQRFLAVLP
ncbi:MAG: hypothetical protein WAW75_06135 [Gallionella sp.]